MASTEIGRRLTEGHRQTQLRLGASTVRLIQSLWPVLNADGRLRVDEWVEAVTILLDRQHRVSADVARAYYSAFRLAEIGEAGFAARGIPTLSLRATATSMIVTGPVRIRQGLDRGLSIDQAAEKAMVASAREGMRIALDGGRSQVTNAVREDRRSVGWARTGSSIPCPFCAMLIGRGPVYKTEGSASFPSHAKCACSAEPVYSRDQPWPPGAREIQELWNTSTSGQSDQINAFRRVYEGRSD